MRIPEKLKLRLNKLGLDESIYENRARKCILSKEKLALERVPWFDDAYYLDEDFSNKQDYLVFDPVSLVPCLALEVDDNSRILDMCAAPGTKTFILSFLTNNQVKIVSNDIDFRRVKRLRYNISRFNLNAEVFNISGRKIEGEFNKIPLDAPCSGEGMINKKEKIFKTWSEKRIKLFSRKQKKLIEHAFDILEKGGTLVYSTCTFEPEENEAVVDFLLKKRSDEILERIEINNIKH